MSGQGTGRRRARRTMALAAFMVVQTLAAIFFVGDALADLVAAPSEPHSLVEALVALALIFGVIFGGWQLRAALERMREQERALDTARGAMADVVDAQFSAWGLTPAESDVALMALKGFDVAEIAGFRGAAPGTVRAQLASIYAKADVSGRAQFAAWFVEDLLVDGVERGEAPRP